MRKFALLAAIAATAFAAQSAAATPLFGKISGSYNAQFQIDSAPSPDDSDPGIWTKFYDVNGIFAGVPDKADLSFFSGGGMAIVQGPSFLFYGDGPKIYTGTEAAPIFAPGSWSLTSDFGAARLTLSTTPPAVPEPMSWALMIAGFVLAGAALRRQRVRLAFAAA
jgi:hypothetical protein